ncbi:469_t:CDS:2, partial [Funneliformis mosseae]
ERNEPLLDYKNYEKINYTRSKRIEKRISLADCTEVSFKEFSNTNAAVPSKTNNEQAHNNEENNSDVKKKSVSYDAKCEVYSVGALLWEIAELKKPHSDLDKSELLGSIRKRVRERIIEPFSDDVPPMENLPTWRPNISDICRDFYKLNENYSEIFFQYNNGFENPEDHNRNEKSSSPVTINILSVNDAIREHKSNDGNRKIAWDSFKYHSSTNIEAKYWLGYYYYHHGEDIPELKQINTKERINMA